MTTWQAVALGAMLAWTPSLIVFVVLLWRAPTLDAAGRVRPAGIVRLGWELAIVAVLVAAVTAIERLLM